MLEWFHNYTGAPWWVVIASTAFAIRLILLPISVRSQQHVAKMQEHQPEMTRLQGEMIRVRAGGNPDEIAAMNAKLMEQMRVVNPFKTMMYALMQTPFFVCTFMALRRLTETHPEMHTQGLFWFTDLAASDPYLRLPILSALGYIVAFEVGADSSAPQGDPRKKFMRFLIYPAMIATAWFTASFPQAVHFYWTWSSFLSVIQVAAFRNETIRSLVGLPKTRPHAPVALPSLPANVLFHAPQAGDNEPQSQTVKANTLNPKKLAQKQRKK